MPVVDFAAAVVEQVPAPYDSRLAMQRDRHRNRYTLRKHGLADHAAVEQTALKTRSLGEADHEHQREHAMFARRSGNEPLVANSCCSWSADEVVGRARPRPAC